MTVLISNVQSEKKYSDVVDLQILKGVIFMKIRKMLSVILTLAIVLSSTLIPVTAVAPGSSSASPQSTTTSTIYYDDNNIQFRVRGKTSIALSTATGTTSFCVLNYSSDDTSLKGVTETCKITSSSITLQNGGITTGKLNGSNYVIGYTGTSYNTVYSKTIYFTSPVVAVTCYHALQTSSPSNLNVSINSSALSLS